MRSKRSLFFVFLFLIIMVGTLFLTRNVLLKKEKKLINISELSEEFIEDYFDEIGEVKSSKEKDNMLIVISDSKIKNSYGADNIIEAPNNQYILQYGTKKEKEAAFAKLKVDKSISSVEENGIYTTEDVTYNSWGIEKMSLDYAINVVDENIAGMNPVTVAVIDTGCDMDLFNKYYDGKVDEFYNVLESSSTVMSDTAGHGTHVSGTIAEGTPSNVKIFPIKVSTNGDMYYSDIIAAINYVVYYEKADVINMSFGGYGHSEALEQAIIAGNEAKIISVAAAGNDNTNKKHYPSSYDSTIAIASVDSELHKSVFSNYGSSISFTAPGTNIRSIMSLGTNDDNEHEVLSGTSMATPHVASAIAIIKSYNNDLGLQGIVNVLKRSSIDLGEEGWDEYFGYGFISFEDVQFCTDGYCDEYGIYKDLDKNIASIELTDLTFTQYNYYSPTNLMASTVRVNYANNTSEDMILSDLPDVEVLNYDPTASSEQTVTIKTGGVTAIVQVTNPDNYESGFEYSTLPDGQIEINGYKSHNLEISRLYIPSEIDSKVVYSLADNVRFNTLSDDFSSYEYLYLPTDFKRIGSYSLLNTNIKYINGDSSGIEIGSHALESSSIVNVETTITKVENNAFKNAYELVYVNISNSLSDIEDYAFYNCKKLIRVKKVKDSAFGYVERVGQYAFYNCVSLSSFQLSVLGDIEDYAFYNSFSLINFDTYQANLIGEYAFYSSGISEADFSSDLVTIKKSSFENCKNLHSVGLVAGIVEARAFRNSNVEDLTISSELESIAEDAFAYTRIKHTYGSSDEGVYSVVPTAGIIETESKKLVIGSTWNLNIPDYITEFGDYAFTGNNTIKSISLPASVAKVGTNTFRDCYNLSDVYIYSNNIEISNTAFEREHNGEVINSDLKLYVYRDSAGEEYAINKDIEYRYFVPDEILIVDNREVYAFGEEVDPDDLTVKLIYHEAVDREEILLPLENQVGYYITYQNGDYITANDSYYVVHGITSAGYEFTQNVNIIITDNDSKTIVNPVITIADKTYDGTTSIPLANVSVFGLEDGEYSIVSVSSASADAGDNVATVKLRLSTEKFKDYSFDEGMREKEFAVNFYIAKADISVTDNSKNVNVLYDGNAHHVDMHISYDNGATLKYMDENGDYTLDEVPEYTEIGTYVTKYKVYINDNYNSYLGQRTLTIRDMDPYIIDEYTVDFENGYISGIEANTTVDEFKSKIELSSGYTIDVEYKVVDNKKVLYTGGKTRIYNGETLYIEFTNIVSGDTSGDGKINYLDYVKVYNHIQKVNHPDSDKNLLTGEYLIAGDMSGDGRISYLDYVKIYNKIKALKGGSN